MYIYIYLNALLLFYSSFTTLYNGWNPTSLKYIYIYSFFTPTLLLILLCVMYVLVFVGLQCCWWRGRPRVGVSCVTRLVYCKCVW